MYLQLVDYEWMMYLVALRDEFCLTCQDYISDVAAAIVKEEQEEFTLECVGILGNLTIPDLDYELLLREYDLVSWIKHKIQPGLQPFGFFFCSVPASPAFRQGYGTFVRCYRHVCCDRLITLSSHLVMT